MRHTARWSYKLEETVNTTSAPYGEIEIGLHRLQPEAYQVEIRVTDPCTEGETAPARGPARVSVEESRQLENSPTQYGATESFNYLHEKYPEYSYKEAALNPTNLRDRALDWEADIVSAFRKDPKKISYAGERDTPEGRSMFLAQPLIVTPECLECHDTAARAPASMIKHYGAANGLGWKKSGIIGAQIVSVPMAVPFDMARREFRWFLLSLGLVGIFVLAILNLVLFLAVIRPISRVSASAEAISQGNLNVPELPVAGKDEIEALASSFNRMHRSLAKAMQLLEGE